MTLPDDTRERSVLLAKASGWESKGKLMSVSDFDDEKQVLYCIYDQDGQPNDWGHCFTYQDQAWERTPDLYDPANMALAHRAVLAIGLTGLDDVLDDWVTEFFWQSDFQTLILDKALALLIEAGLVNLEVKCDN